MARNPRADSDHAPVQDELDARERDVSVLFPDIEAYTKITERMGATRLSAS